MKKTILITLLLQFLYTGIAFAKDRDFIYDAKDSRDPFIPFYRARKKPVKEGAVDITRMRLEGIIWRRKGRSLVIIDDHIFERGDRIRGFEILKIERGKIILFRDGEKFILHW